MTCPQPDVDLCLDETPCDTCPAVCPYCRETWQAHVDGNPCSTTEETQVTEIQAVCVHDDGTEHPSDGTLPCALSEPQP